MLSACRMPMHRVMARTMAANMNCRVTLGQGVVPACRHFASDAPAVPKEQPKSAPTPPKPKKQAGRIRMFVTGFGLASAVGFWILFVEVQQSLNELKNQVNAVQRYQENLERRLPKEE
eukprot:GEMP01031294.1.p1 GENE.GEMP01031294.1~~GEMP01031294.1.p1  ORF type:complete len:134 (+),score=30.83 GEMP01031294.1:51-404(+)